MSFPRFGKDDYVLITRGPREGTIGFITQVMTGMSYEAKLITGPDANHKGTIILDHGDLKPTAAVYPELDRRKPLLEESQKIGVFIDWLRENGMDICKVDPKSGDYHPCYKSIEQHLADFYEIDLNLVAIEQDRLLRDFRRAREKEEA